VEAGEVTRFGAVWTPLDRTAAVLRARASRFGAALPAATNSPDHTAAAVAAVESWMVALNASTLDRPARYGRNAVAALAASLCLLEGEPPSVGIPPTPIWTPPPSWFTTVDRLSDWCADLQLRRGVVLTLAAEALAVGAENERLAAMSTLLSSAAHQR
jgi:hypothetical protein